LNESDHFELNTSNLGKVCRLFDDYMPCMFSV
jgi:hypothetical protein